MVDISVEILSYNLPEKSGLSIIFHVNTPWVKGHRLWRTEKLNARETKNMFLPTWSIPKCVTFLNMKPGGPDRIAMFIEFRYTNAPVDDLKHPGTIEELGGMSGMINLYDMILGFGPNPIIQELQMIDVLENKRLGSINARINCAIWPALQELLIKLPLSAPLPSPKIYDPILSSCKDLSVPSSPPDRSCNVSAGAFKKSTHDSRIILGHNAAVASFDDSLELSDSNDVLNVARNFDPDHETLDSERPIVLEEDLSGIPIPSAIPKRLLPSGDTFRTPTRVQSLKNSMLEDIGSPRMFRNTPEIVQARKKYRSLSCTHTTIQALSPTSIGNAMTRVRQRVRAHTESYNDEPEREDCSFLFFEKSLNSSTDCNSPQPDHDDNNNSSQAGGLDHRGNKYNGDEPHEIKGDSVYP